MLVLKMYPINSKFKNKTKQKFWTQFYIEKTGLTLTVSLTSPFV